jgi:hypothetical protein
MPNPDFQALSDELARKTELLETAQDLLDANKHLFSEEQAWGIQAHIDETRFAIELDRLVLLAKLSK